jgi:hypothetical protein
MTLPTVGPIGQAVFGAPEACPLCGGELVPVFGVNVDERGVRRPVLDPTSASCQDCRQYFKTAQVVEK